MNVLAPHTTAIHKRDVKTHLEALDANVKMALLEMVSAVEVCPHSLKHHMPSLYYEYFFPSFRCQ